MNVFLWTAVLVALAASATVAGAPESPPAPFVHPGLLHSRADLERMRQNVAAGVEPWKSGYAVFAADAHSQATYNLRGPLASVGRNPTVGQGEYDSDANAAYQCALMWQITGERAYADKSKEIVNAWAATLKTITGRDAVLMAGLGPFKMINAAEILRATNAGWSNAEAERCAQHFREVVYPVVKDFAPFANGNWDTAAIKTVLAIGVFCDDRAIFERGLRYYVDGAGDGRLTHYIINEAGQCQESGRDMPHTQLGLAHLGDGCEIAWNQGLDLYAYADNRLLKGFEYTAPYNLGENVPFVETLDRTGKYHHTEIATAGRGRLRSVFEQIYNHYVHRRGLEAPYTRRAAEKVRPEGPGLPGADHPGFGTLLFSRPPAPQPAPPPSAPPAAPAGIIARGAPPGNTLRWVACVGATTYAVKRATQREGPYTTLDKNVQTTTFTDTNVMPGTVFFYVVSASNGVGESPNAFPAGISAGLPSPWTHSDIGPVGAAGDARFDGAAFTLEAAGNDIGETSDQLQFAHQLLNGDGTITPRFVPQTNSQFAEFGLMLRASDAAGAAFVALLLSPEPGRSVEAPGWKASLSVREAPGKSAAIAASSDNLGDPYVTFGRLTGACWLRLTRSNNTFAAAISPDGRAWTAVGTATIALPNRLLAGLAACSHLRTVTTVVTFDHVAVSEFPVAAQGSAPKMNDVKVAGTLPDPLVLADGTRVTTPEQWRAQRRPELLRLFEQEMYGRTPIGRPADLRFAVREEKKNARGGRATRLRVGVLFEGRDDGRQMELLLYLPNAARGPVPVFLGLNFDGNFTTTDEPDIPLPAHYVNGLFQNRPADHRAHEAARGIHAAMFPYDKILERGYGIATACYGEVEPDRANQWWHGPRVLGGAPGANDWGAIGAWAWALSRAVDYLQTNPRVDPERIAVFGFSRLGKTALWAGAQDERFALVVSQNSGKGGVSLSKRLTGEPVAHLAGKDLGHWFAPAYARYADNEAALPVDGHLLAALIAPRPLLILSATEDAWSDPEGEFLGGRGADPVYRLLGTNGLAAPSWPAPQTRVTSTIGYYLRPGGHNVTGEDWEATLDFADKHLASKAVPRAPRP